MIRVLSSLAVAFSLIVLSAHFWRSGNPVAASISLAAILLLAAPSRWAVIPLRLLLLAGAMVWLLSLKELASKRIAAGEPWVRLAIILGGVAAFTVLSAFLAGAGRESRGEGSGGLSR